MSSSEEQMLAGLARRNWIIFMILLALSFLLGGKEQFVGVACGGLIAVCGYQWLHHSLVKALSVGGDYAVRGFQLSYMFRLLALVVMLVLLVAVVKVDPIGLIIGLSVVVINIMVTTLRRVIK